MTELNMTELVRSDSAEVVRGNEAEEMLKSLLRYFYLPSGLDRLEWSYQEGVAVRDIQDFGGIHLEERLLKFARAHKLDLLGMNS